MQNMLKREQPTGAIKSSQKHIGLAEKEGERRTTGVTSSKGYKSPVASERIQRDEDGNETVKSNIAVGNEKRGTAKKLSSRGLLKEEQNQCNGIEWLQSQLKEVELRLSARELEMAKLESERAEEKETAETQIKSLREENALLEKKVERLNGEQKKALRMNVSLFNEEGQEVIRKKERIVELEGRVAELEVEIAEFEKRENKLKEEIEDQKKKIVILEDEQFSLKQGGQSQDSFCALDSTRSALRPCIEEFMDNPSILRLVEDNYKRSNDLSRIIEDPQSPTGCLLEGSYLNPNLNMNSFQLNGSQLGSCASEESLGSQHYSELMEVIRNQFRKALWEFQEGNEKALREHEEAVVELQRENRELGRELVEALEKQERPRLSLNNSGTELELTRLKTQFEVYRREQDEVVEQLRDDLVLAELRAKRMTHEAGMLGLKNFLTADNDLFDLNVVNLNQARALSQLKQQLQHERDINKDLLLKQRSQDSLIEAFASKKSKLRVFK